MDWFEFWMKAFLALMGAILLGLIGLLLFMACDSVGLQEKAATGIVTGRHYRPPYTTTTIVSTGRSTIPVINHYPARYEVCVTMETVEDGGCGNFSRPFWEDVESGDEVLVTYARGRFSGEIYIRGIEY